MTRRVLFCGAAAFAIRPALAASKDRESHLFLTEEAEVRVTIAFYDRHRTAGKWFQNSPLTAAFGGPNFHGSLAVAEYKIRARSDKKSVTTLREYVRTIDHDTRLDGRPPFERTIRLDRGIASDLQAFGYQGAPNEPLIGPHGPWYLFRQDLYLDGHAAPFLVVHWKHALTAIRILNIAPGDQTRILESP